MIHTSNLGIIFMYNIDLEFGAWHQPCRSNHSVGGDFWGRKSGKTHREHPDPDLVFRPPQLRSPTGLWSPHPHEFSATGPNPIRRRTAAYRGFEFRRTRGFRGNFRPLPAKIRLSHSYEKCCWVNDVGCGKIWWPSEMVGTGGAWGSRAATLGGAWRRVRPPMAG